MGYFTEAAKYIERMRSNLSYNAKKPVFDEVINCCYFIAAVVDSFVHTRDMDYLNKEFQTVRDIGTVILKYSSRLKNFSDVSTNSQAHFWLENPLCCDLALIAAVFLNAAYFARCKGIFGEEKKFNEESARIQKIIAADESYLNNELFFLMLFTKYPFNLPGCLDAWTNVLKHVKDYFHERLIKNKSIGFDIFSSLVAANNMLFGDTQDSADIYSEIDKIGGKRYCLPEFVDTQNRRGVWGSGSSKICSAEMFSLLRNMIFIDSPERLTIFPKPKKEWFAPGKDFLLENAPSRFGPINFRYSASENDVTFHFDVLPKFIPPEVVITMPSPMKIQKNDDFLLKKSSDGVYIISGWPSFIRFTRS
jgi:hypothetical protein